MISTLKRKKAKSAAVPSPQLIEQRRIRIQSEWSPEERRHRAQQAVEQVHALWAVIAGDNR
jgi:hypothetical protein